MNYNKKFGYTLAEVMIVLLLLSIIFAAFAPIITKRKTTTSNLAWDWTSSRATNNEFDNQFNAYTAAHRLFFGLTPTNNQLTGLSHYCSSGTASPNCTFYPDSRMIIRSLAQIGDDDIQRQIQFRFGGSRKCKDRDQRVGICKDTTGYTDNNFAGSWLMDGKNILVGGKYANLKYTSNQSQRPNHNIGFGYMALSNIENSVTPAKNNIAIGSHAGYSIESNASDNIFVGYYAGYSNNTGTNNIAVGSHALFNNTTGSENIAIGAAAGYRNTVGSRNIFIGRAAGAHNIIGSENVAIGYNTLTNLQNGSYNVAAGFEALKNLESGDYNVAIGKNACLGFTNTSYKTCIGANSGPNKTNIDEDKDTRNDIKDTRGDIGDIQVTYLGYRPQDYWYITNTYPKFGGDAVVEIYNPKTTNDNLKYLYGNEGLDNSTNTSNATTVINGNLIVRGRLYSAVGSNIYAWQNITQDGVKYFAADKNIYKTQGDDFGPDGNWPNLQTTSDRRLKNIGSKNNSGLEKISKLQIYSYNFKNDNTKEPHVGVIAQELQKIFPNSVTEDESGYLKIKWDEMFYASINAIKQLDKKIIALIKRTTKVEAKITKLEQQNQELKTQVAALSVRVEKLKSKNSQ